MISRPFIERPRLALVISIVITLVGTISLFNIPVAQYPEITPPEISVSTAYPGADAKTVSESVAAPIEAEINGVEGMIYMSSTSSNDGLYQLSVTFEVGTDPNVAQINVQNRVQIASTRLPKEVTQQGITVRKRTADIMAVVSFYSPKGTFDNLFLSNFVSQNIRDVLLRVPGVSDVFIFGELQYSMRIWIYPERLLALNMGVDEVISALQAQNIQAAVGAIGKAPMSDGPEIQFTLQSKGRLKEPKEFENIVLRNNPKGGIVYLKDVARVELGSSTYSTRSLYNGSPNLGLAIYKSPEANALKTMKDVLSALEGLKERMPQDIEYKVIYDTTLYVKAAVQEIRWTLLLTFLLVVFVTYLFLQDWRATVIPAITVPVSLLGTFAVLLALGYTANTISLFALILAIGLVVDDAIVVVENAYRIINEEGLDSKEATIKAMKQVTGPVIATTLVLLAVFVPVGFIPGITGRLYKEFAVTLCTAVVISTINALTLSPALCGVLLGKGDSAKGVPIFSWFNRGLWAWRGFYVSSSRWLIRRIGFPVLLLLGVIILASVFFQRTPTSFLPEEDQGAFFVNYQLPEGANLNRTVSVAKEITERIRAIEGVEGVLCVPGFSILSGTAENVGFGIAILKPWDKRKSQEQSVNNILRKAQSTLMGISGANIVAFGLPAIRGLGRTGGFDLRVQALRGQDPQELASVGIGVILEANKDPRLERVFTTFTADTPQIYLEVDRVKAEAMNVSIGDLFNTLQSYLGSKYINDFNLSGRVYQVRVQADEEFRKREEDILRLYVKSKTGQMVPIRNLVEQRPIVGPQLIYRYNQYQSLQINGQGRRGVSSAEAMAAMEEILKRTLPEGYGYEWSSISFQEKRVKGQVVYLFVLAVIFGYLFLAGQYESFLIPIPIIISISVAVLGGLLGVWFASLNRSIYVEIGIILLVGLASKNAILIVEFSKDLRQEGKSILDAALEGARIRFRPVLMTAFTFIMGVAPMVMATG
ncbi:MAG: efflux RND transporter permease subunit, partial [Desulfatiglandales bacterium]